MNLTKDQANFYGEDKLNLNAIVKEIMIDWQTPGKKNKLENLLVGVNEVIDIQLTNFELV